MRDVAGPVSKAIASRRSVRRFADRIVEPRLVEELIELACAAPAPHHTRPWRFVNVASAEGRERLADAMGDAWRKDMEAAGRPVREIAGLIERSRGQVTGAPVLLLACLLSEGARKWSDRARQQAERDMFVQSLGAALQNILLAAAERGVAGYLKGAPLFCAQAVSEALRLPRDWEPTFLVLLGHRPAGFEAPPRAPIDASEFMVER